MRIRLQTLVNLISDDKGQGEEDQRIYQEDDEEIKGRGGAAAGGGGGGRGEHRCELMRGDGSHHQPQSPSGTGLEYSYAAALVQTLAPPSAIHTHIHTFTTLVRSTSFSIVHFARLSQDRHHHWYNRNDEMALLVNGVCSCDNEDGYCGRWLFNANENGTVVA